MMLGFKNWRETVGQGFSALRSITEASSISFVDTEEVKKAEGHLANLHGELEKAMAEERYDDATLAKKQIHLMLLTSQRSQRVFERRQVEEMAQQMQQSMTKAEGVLQKLAKKSWHRSESPLVLCVLMNTQ